MGHAESAAADTIVVDCASGLVTRATLTTEEVAARYADAEQHRTAQQAEADRREQLVAVVAASADPAMQALATLLGVIPSRDVVS